MRGSAVAIIFIVVNIIAVSIFLIVSTTSIKTSILTEEKLSRESLNTIIDIYYKKNIASQNYYNAVSVIPRIDIYTLHSLSNYIQRVKTIEADATLIEKPLTFQEYQYLQARITENIDKINYTARNYPVLRTNQNYITALNEMRPIIEDERKSISLYNDYVAEYNKLTTTPPSSIVAGIMGKFPFLRFETGTNIIAQTAHMFQ
ncbi:LemA family protein [Brachyspira murdochii]|uniref:LemA family protein n=2 Tax=Brachyspira murdochii TaxID=84378 RepID=D5UB78_BRAM5|nr:LemA family protein [Brachyspira murdochii]ADG71951.1 LemA family protein [Brachyspira murdochii DSM 12563]PPS23051.1 membrane protein [Brachyspira murdochii]